MAVVSLLKVDTGYYDRGERGWLGRKLASSTLRGGTVLPSGTSAGAKAGCTLLSQAVPGAETGWGPGPFAAVLRQTSPGATEYKETRRDKNNHVHVQLGQVMDNKIQKDQKLPTATSEELGAKQRIAVAPSTQEHRSGGQTA